MRLGLHKSLNLLPVVQLYKQHARQNEFTDSMDFIVSFVVMATSLGATKTGMPLNGVLWNTKLLSHCCTDPIHVWIIVKQTHKRKYLQKSNPHSACQPGCKCAYDKKYLYTCNRSLSRKIFTFRLL